MSTHYNRFSVPPCYEATNSSSVRLLGTFLSETRAVQDEFNDGSCERNIGAKFSMSEFSQFLSNVYTFQSYKCSLTQSRFKDLCCRVTSLTGWFRQFGLTSPNARLPKIGCLFVGFVLMLWVYSLSQVDSFPQRQLVRLRDDRELQGAMLCRLIIIETAFEAPSGSLMSEASHSCIPIVGGLELDDFYSVDLPASFAEQHSEALSRGSLYAWITDAEPSDEEDKIILSASSIFSVEDSPVLSRRLKNSDAIGERTVAVVRVSTSDAQVGVSAEVIDSMLFGDGVNFVSQYSACSFGQLQWKRSEYGVVDILLDQPLWNFTSASSVVAAAEKVVIDRYNLELASDLADNVLFCVPEGLGTWAASAGVNYWRSQFNNDWCTSLTATMHELGHNLGLLHSNENGEKYADQTGYMASGYKASHWPLKCFNGFNSWVLGWYKDRQVSVDPIASGAVLLKLAAFVDYELATEGEPVVVNILDQFYLQYNRAKGFNEDTGEKRDQVTITEDAGGGSDNRGGLSVGMSWKYEKFRDTEEELIVAVCDGQQGEDGYADTVLVSIGIGESLCETLSPSASPSRAPSTVPTARPTIAPSLAPSTRKPTTAPSVAPTKATSGWPTRSPVGGESSTIPSIMPTLRPSVVKASPTSDRPSVFPSNGENPTCGGFGVVCGNEAPTLSPIDTASVRPSLNPKSCGFGVPCGTPSVAPVATVSATETPSGESNGCGGFGVLCPTKSPTTAPTGIHPLSYSSRTKQPTGIAFGVVFNSAPAASPTTKSLLSQEHPTTKLSNTEDPDFLFGSVFFHDGSGTTSSPGQLEQSQETPESNAIDFDKLFQPGPTTPTATNKPRRPTPAPTIRNVNPTITGPSTATSDQPPVSPISPWARYADDDKHKELAALAGLQAVVYDIWMKVTQLTTLFRYLNGKNFAYFHR